MSQRPGLDVVTQRADLNIQVVDGIQGIADILAFGQAQDRLSKITSTGKSYGDSQKHLARINGVHSGSISLHEQFRFMGCSIFMHSAHHCRTT